MRTTTNERDLLHLFLFIVIHVKILTWNLCHQNVFVLVLVVHLAKAVYACRMIGAGYAGLEKFCGMKNMPRPMTNKNFDKISLVLGSSAQAVAESSMSATAVELRKPSMKDLPADIGVSVDGTWQKRGYVSLNGVVAVISMDSGKVIDMEVMLRYCLACQKNKDSVTDDEFLTWYESHKFCSANQEGHSSNGG